MLRVCAVGVQMASVGSLQSHEAERGDRDRHEDVPTDYLTRNDDVKVYS